MSPLHLAALGLAAAAALALSGCATTPDIKPGTPLEATPASAVSPAPDSPGSPPSPDAVAAAGTDPERPAEGAPPGPPPEPPEVEPLRTYPASLQEAFTRAARAAESGDTAGATRLLEQVLAEEPRADFAWTNLGMLQEPSAPAKAESTYRKALSLAPDQDRAWDALGRLMCRTGRCEAFISEARARAAKRPRALGPRNALAFGLVQLGRLEEAAAEAKAVLKDDERNVRAMQVLAQVFTRQAKWELARMVLERARVIDPKDPLTHNALGLVQLQFKTIPRTAAQESFTTAVRLKPDFVEALSNQGAMLIEVDDFPAAIALLERAVALAPDYAEARMNLANAYRGDGKPEQALAQYQKVQGLLPKNADTWFNLGILYLDAEMPNVDTLVRYETAIQHFTAYAQAGGKDERTDLYFKDARKAIEK
jgi:tetratricopeptide (TPR) repeat protein